MLSTKKVCVFFVIIFFVCGGFASTLAQYYPLSQNTLTSYVNYSGAGYIWPSGSNLFYYGETVTVKAYTYSGYVFDGWYLNGVYQGKLSTISLTMTEDYTLYAVFSQKTSSLVINCNPSDGGTTIPSSGIWNYTGGSVTVTQIPAQGNTFNGWYLDGIYQGLGTSITVNMNQDHQLTAFFSGSGTINPSPTPTPTPVPTPIPQPNLPTPTLSFYCASSPSTAGFYVKLNGALAYNGTGISGTGVTFSYSATGGATWHDLAYVITGDDGNFSAVWMPSASGNYVIRGTWFSDGVYSGVTNTMNFSVAPNSQNDMFSVSSNSTLSSLSFDSATSRLSFSVSGETGTTGYVQACIPKTLLADTSKLQVSLDGQEIPYHTFTQGETWIITIEYTHSTHSVVMALGSSATPTPTQTPTSNPTSNPTTNPTSNPTSNPTATSTPDPTSALTSSPTPTETTQTPNPTTNFFGYLNENPLLIGAIVGIIATTLFVIPVVYTVKRKKK